MTKSPKFGARVYALGGRRKILVKQTVLRGQPAEYVIDEQKEKYAAWSNDKEIADAVRAAISEKI